MTLRIGYVINTYPRPSHSFIRREIQALEDLGVMVHRFAMRPADGGPSDPADCAEQERTEYILQAGGPGLLRALAAQIGAAPRQFTPALALARQRAAAGESSLSRQLIYLAEGAQLARRAQALGLTHLHAHFGTNSARVASYARLLGGPGYSFTIHGPEEFDHPEALDLAGKLALSRFGITVSSFGRAQLLRWAADHDRDKIAVVHCGLDLARQPAPLPLPPPPLRMVAVGRFAEQKGFGLLIRAFIPALRSAPAIRLALVGDGELRPQIEALIAAEGISHAVDLLGWQDEAGVRAAMDQAHVLVAPSFAEGLPVVIMEAMARARPVISTYIAGIPELLRNQQEGWLVPAGDTEALSAAMLEAAASGPEVLQRMAQSARQRVHARHDIRDSADALLELFTHATG